MKKSLPPSITRLLNGAAVLPPVEPVQPIEIPTRGTNARQAWKQARHAERLARATRRAIDRGLDVDLPF